MLKSSKYRLYPTKSQAKLLDKHFGCARFVYNWALDKKINYYKKTKRNISSYEIIKQIIILKRQFGHGHANIVAKLMTAIS